ncbi:hypothetical protein Agub_g12141, partial [Astrephomene gubernaculifera]
NMLVVLITIVAAYVAGGAEAGFSTRVVSAPALSPNRTDAAKKAHGASPERTTTGGAEAVPVPTSPELELVGWLLGMGAQVRVEVRRSGAGVRGLYTAAAAAAGEVLVRVPLSAAVVLGGADDTAPELAVQLLRERYRTRPRFAPYFAVLPPPPPAVPPPPPPPPPPPAAAAPSQDGEPRQQQQPTSSSSSAWQPACVEEFPRAAVAALAGRELRLLASSKREWMRRVWSGEAAVRLPLARAVPRRHVSLQEFAWATCMVTSRSISGPGGSLLLIPLIDLANHCTGRPPPPSLTPQQDSTQSDTNADAGSNSSKGGDTATADAVATASADPPTGSKVSPRRPDQLRFVVGSGGSGGGGGGGGSSGDVMLELVAGQDLAAGEEVCISYGDLRPDEALLYYGFLLPTTPRTTTPTEEHLPAQQPAPAPHTSASPTPPAQGDEVPVLFAVDEREYDSSGRPGKVPYK